MTAKTNQKYLAHDVSLMKGAISKINKHPLRGSPRGQVKVRETTRTARRKVICVEEKI